MRGSRVAGNKSTKDNPNCHRRPATTMLIVMCPLTMGEVWVSRLLFPCGRQPRYPERIGYGNDACMTTSDEQTTHFAGPMVFDTT